jgi:flagellar protein FliT
MDDRKPPLAEAGGAAGDRTASLLQHYESIAAASRQMVAAARAQDWQRVQQLERHCVQQVQHLKTAARDLSLSAAEQSTRVRLLRGILADDAEIRRLAEPWLLDLEHLLLPRAARSGGPRR